MPVTTLTDGTAIAIIAPNASVQGGYAVNGSYLPFCTIAAGSSTLPYLAVPNYAPAGPFVGQYGSISTYAVDLCSIDFQ